MAKQGGGIARITSFFGVAEYEGAHEHQGNSEAEGAATSASLKSRRTSERSATR